MSDLTLLQLRVLWEISKKPRCGYELMKIEEKKVTQGTIYPLLKSMENLKLIKKKPGQGAGRSKKYYTITAKGRKVLKESGKSLCLIYKDIFREHVCRRCRR